MVYDLPIEIIQEFDEMYIGVHDRLPIAIFSNKSASAQNKIALNFFRYAFETRLHWSPTEIRDYLTMEVIDDLKLSAIFNYIIFPPGLVPESSLFYIAWMIYPKTVNKRIEEVELITYRKYLDGTLKKLPQNYFKDERGLERAYNCLIDRLNYLQPIVSTDPFYMYEFFVSPGCIPFLAKAKLTKVCAEYHLSPLEFFFRALSKSQRDYAMFSYFEFMLHYKPVTLITPKESIHDDTEIDPLITEEDDFA